MATEKGGRKGINWLAVRTYVVEGHSVAEAAKRFNVSRQLVSKRCSEEGWNKQRDENVTLAQIQLDKLDAASKADALVNHVALADDIVNAVRAGLQEILADKAMSPRSKAEAIKVYAEAADKGVRLGRDTRGIKSGQPSDATGEDMTDAIEFHIIKEEPITQASAG